MCRKLSYKNFRKSIIVIVKEIKVLRHFIRRIVQGDLGKIINDAERLFPVPKDNRGIRANRLLSKLKH